MTYGEDDFHFGNGAGHSGKKPGRIGSRADLSLILFYQVGEIITHH
jgi:hypothetical protein